MKGYITIWLDWILPMILYHLLISRLFVLLQWWVHVQSGITDITLIWPDIWPWMTLSLNRNICFVILCYRVQRCSPVIVMLLLVVTLIMLIANNCEDFVSPNAHTQEVRDSNLESSGILLALPVVEPGISPTRVKDLNNSTVLFTDVFYVSI